MHHNKSMYITNVEKEGPFLKIWGQIDKKSSLEVEEALLRASERFEEGKYKLGQNSLEVGILCCAKYVDEKYYRARIASIALLTDGMVDVNFIDYGNKDMIPVGNLRSLECFNPSFISLPPLSSPFILAEVVCIGGEWNDRIVEQISKEIRYMEHNYVIIAQAIRYYFIKVFVHEIDLGLHLVRQNLMQSTSIQTQEAVLLAMIPRTPQPTPPPNQSLLQYKSFTLEPNSQHEVYVSYITDGPCHFSVQLKKYESALAQLMRDINSIPLKPLEELPIPGTVCLAKCVEDNHICRAVVTSEVDSQYKLFYVDFGNTELVPPENLYQMAFKFIIPKIMAIRLSLASIEKTSMTIEMQCAFKQFVDNRLLMMEVLPAAKKMALPKCRMWDPDTNIDVIEVLNRAAKCAYPDPIALHKGFTQLVKVSFVYSCNRFYVQLKSKEADLNQLMEELQVYCNSNQTSYLDKAKVGQPCCALFSFDQKWYRSLITEIEGDNVKVRYIDFGNEEFVPIDSLKVVEGEYLTVLRPQAIECCLNGYQNMAEDAERDIKLEELILEQEFTMKVIDAIGSKTLVDLMDAVNTTVTALLLESIMAQTKVQTAAPPSETGRFESGGKRQGAGEEWRGDDRNSKPYFQHDDRRSPRGQNWKEKTDDNTSWRQNSRKRSDSNSNESTESWRQDNRGFKNRKENDWNDRSSSNNTFKEDRGFRGRSGNAENERPPRNRNQSGEWGGAKEDGRNQNKPPRNQNENWGGAKEDSWNQNKSSRNANGAWKDNDQGFKKKYDRENKDWGKNENGDFKGRTKTENSDWNNKTEKGDWNNKPERNDWNNKSEKSDWSNKGEKGDWKNKNDKSDWKDKPERSDRNNKTGGGGDWTEKKPYQDRNTNRDDWNANKGGSDRKYGDRNRDNDRGEFKKKAFRRETNELSSSESEKSFGKGLRTSSRNDNRPPRSDRKFGGNKSSDNSWNVSAVPSVIDSAPNDAKFKSIDVGGREEKVAISWFHNPCSFFCQLVDSQESFKKLMEDIQQAYKGRPSGSCVKGAPAVGLFPEDNVLYRARIMEVLDGQYKIHYVDFGNVSVVDKVWPIENKFMEMPMQAIPCGLNGLEPVSDNWPNPDNYSEYFEREGLNCTFLNCDESGRYWVNLTADKEDVTQQLVDNALAKYTQSTAVNVDIGLLVGQQFRAMLQQVNACSDFTMLLQSGITLSCAMHNLSTAAEINEDLLKQQLDQLLIVYVDDLLENRLEVTLYDSTGTKLNVIEPDEGAFDAVDPLCPHLVASSTLCGFVSHVNEASLVVQPSECAQNVDYLVEQMYEYYENMPPPDALLVPEEESVYAVKSDDGNWYRGRVTAFDDDKATVTYVDYGNSEEVAFSRLRDITPEMLMWDAMAVLINVKVPTADFADQTVTATIFYGETGWEGEVQLAEATEQPIQSQAQTEQPLPTQSQTEPEQTPESSSIQFVEITQETPETTLTQSEETTDISLVREESASSGVENDNVVPFGGTAAILSHVDSPSDFYIQLLDSLPAIDELQLRLQDMVGEMTQLESASVGGLCAAPYSVDQQWYRSQILDADDDITTVRFIDYGSTDVIDNNATQIKTLPAELLALEEYATRCRLKIKPSEEDWPKAAVDRFEQLTTVDHVTVQFVDQDEKTNYVELYGDGVNVKDALIAENLALVDDVALDGKLTGFVSHMNSPSEFWMQLESCCAELEWIAEQLSNAASFRDLEDLTPGSLCAAMFPDDEMWYRARILSNTVAGLEVLFLDYGNSCVCSNLKQLPEHLVMAPPLAQKCSLQKPEGSAGWSREASARFSELSADGQTIFAVRKLTTGETSVVELLANGEDVSSKLMADNGYVTDLDSTQSPAKETEEQSTEDDKVVPEIAPDEIRSVQEEKVAEVKDIEDDKVVPDVAPDVPGKNEETVTEVKEIEDGKVVSEITVEKVCELPEENKEKETDVKDIEGKKEDKKIIDVTLENIPALECKEEPLEKLEEASDKGKAHPDVEYLSDNTVRLYLDENNINNELKELLSPILKEKKSGPVSVVATIEIIPEPVRKEEEKSIENPRETEPCQSHDTSRESYSECQEIESVQMIESLVDNIVGDVYSNTSPPLNNDETLTSRENYLDQDEFSRFTTTSSEETEELCPLECSERPISENEFSESTIAPSAEMLPLEASEQAIREDEIDKFAALPSVDVLPFEFSEQSICETGENNLEDKEKLKTDSRIAEPNIYLGKTENETDSSSIIKHEIYTLDSQETNPRLLSESQVMDTDVHEISDCITKQDVHGFVISEDVILEDVDTLKQTATNFVITEKEICDDSNQQEKTIEAKTDTHDVTTQLKIEDVRFVMSSLTSKEDIYDCDIGQQTTEEVKNGSEVSNGVSTEQKVCDNSHTTEIDATKLQQECTENKDDIIVPSVQSDKLGVDIESNRKEVTITDTIFLGHQNIEEEIGICKENLQNTQSLVINPEIELTELKSTNEIKNYSHTTKLQEEYTENKDDINVSSARSEDIGSNRKDETISDTMFLGQQNAEENPQRLIVSPKIELTESRSTNESKNYLHTTEIDATKLQEVCTNNKDVINVPNVQSEELGVDIESSRKDEIITDTMFSGHQNTEKEIVLCKDNLQNSQSFIRNPELTESKSTNENKNDLDEQVSEVSRKIEPYKTENNDPTSHGIACEGILEESSEPVVEKENSQTKCICCRDSLEVACEYLELHKMENSTKVESKQIPLEDSEKADRSMSTSEQQETENSESNIVSNSDDAVSEMTVAQESEADHEVCLNSKPCDISPKNSVNLKSKDDRNGSKVEFIETILTSFSAPTISEYEESMTKLSPSKIVPKSQTDLIEKLDAFDAEEKKD